jgi:hypothetical protein
MMNDEQNSAPWQELSPLQPRPVDFFAHFAGAFVDGLIVVLVLIVLVVMVSMAESYAFPRKVRLPAIIADLTAWALLLLHGMSEIMATASPGKWVASLTTRRADASPAPRWRLAVRWAVKASPLLVIGAGTAIDRIASMMARGNASLGEFPSAAIVRAYVIGHVLSWVVVLGTLLALLPPRRTLHDWIAGTAVFYRNELGGAKRYIERGFEVQAVSPVIGSAIDVEPVAAMPQNSRQATDPQ